MVKKSKKQIERDEQLYQLVTLVAGELSLQEVLDKLAEAAVLAVGVKACSIRLLDDEAGDLKMRSTYGLSEEYRNKGQVSKHDDVIKAAFDGKAVVVDDMRIDGRVKYKKAAKKEGLVSQLTVVMRFRNKGIGVLRLYSPKPKHFDEDDIVLARAVASQCAVAITNARLYSRAVDGARMAEQMRLAGIVQRRMIPDSAPLIDGFDIAATYIPCFDVGGDFYDFIKPADGRLVIAIADVIGKGVPAAIMTSSFRGALRAYSDMYHDPGDICDVIAKLNRLACDECRDGEFVTLFYAVFDTKKKTLTYCNCGHEPVVLSRNGCISDMEAGGLVLGVERDVEYEIETLDLSSEDVLLFYTDGLTDAINYEGSSWGREKMLKALLRHVDGSAEQIVGNLLRYRRRFVGLAKQIDDTSVIAVKITKE